jgi:hypothetical protein
MDNTAAFGRLVGWASIVAGLAALAIGLMIDSPERALTESQACEANRRLGFRAAPCPVPASGDKVLLLGAGGGAIASGVFFLLLSGILTTLVQMHAAQEADRRSRGQATNGAARRLPLEATVGAEARDRFIHPPATNPAIDLPTRFALQQRYGEPLGNRAHALLYAAHKRGETLTEEDAVRAARQEQGG